MNKNKKALLVLGTISATVAPVATVISCGANKDWKYNDNDFIIGNIKAKDLLDKTEKSSIVEGKNWNIVLQQSAFYFYEQEQKASLDVQKSYFELRLFKIEDEIKDFVSDKDKTKELNKEKQKIKDKLSALKDANAFKSKYDSPDFSTEYPKVLLPISEIREQRAKIYRDEKNAYISAPKTKALGEGEWNNTVRAKNYGGATTDEQAIDYLVYKVIKPNAFLRNSFSKNVEFTLKDLKWINDPTQNTNNAFPFLKIKGFDATSNATLKTTVNDSKDTFIRIEGDNTFDDTSKIYFYGSKSNVWADPASTTKVDQKLINLKRINNIKSNANSSGDELRFYRHALLNIHPDSKNPTQPWVVGENTIKKLFAFKPAKYLTTPTEHYFDSIKDLFANSTPTTKLDSYDKKVDKDTDLFLRFASDNSDASKTIGGALGLKNVSGYASEMVSGFALASLSLEARINSNKIITDENNTTKSFADDQAAINTANDDIYKKLGKAIKDVYTKVIQNYGNAAGPTNDQELTEYLAKYDQTKLKRLVGYAVKGVFNPHGNGRDLVYTTKGTKPEEARYAFITPDDKMGIHLVKRFKVNATGFADLTNKALDALSDLDSSTKPEYDLIKYLTPMVSQEKVVKELIKGTTTLPNTEKAKFKVFIEKRISDNLLKLDDEIIGSNVSEKIDDLFKKANEIIKKANDININKKTTSLTEKHIGFIKTNINNYTLKYNETSAQNETLRPEDLYNVAFDVAKKEEA